MKLRLCLFILSVVALTQLAFSADALKGPQEVSQEGALTLDCTGGDKGTPSGAATTINEVGSKSPGVEQEKAGQAKSKGKGRRKNKKSALTASREENGGSQEGPQDEHKEKIALVSTVGGATQSVSGAPSVQGMVIYSYLPNAIYEAFCKKGYVTDIQLQPAEQLISVMAGDTVEWVVSDTFSGSGTSKQYHVLVSPLKAAIETNFVITTDRHVYQLNARARDFYNPSIGWHYPHEENAKLQAIKREERRIEEQNISEAILPERMNFNYKIKEPWLSKYDWTPKMVFDDGSKTYVQMADGMKSSEAPALFIKDQEGNVNLVNYRVKDNYYIVDRLFNEAELRNGKEIVTIKKLTTTK